MADNVLRVDRDANYKTINLHAVADDDSLSAKATGILTYLVTRPDGWEFNKTDIIRRFSDGRTSIDTGLEELKGAGYLSVDRDQREDGTFVWAWTVCEVPTTIPRKSVDGESNDGERGDIVSEKGSKKNSSSTHGDSGNEIPVCEMWSTWVEVVFNGETSRRLTDKREGHLRQLWREHLTDADDPDKRLRDMLRAMLDDDWWGEKPDTWVPETAFKNAERRERWAVAAEDGSTSYREGGYADPNSSRGVA